MDLFEGMDDVRDMLLDSLKTHGIIVGTETAFGGETYSYSEKCFFQHGQLPENESFAVPNMEYNEWQVPIIEPDMDNWDAKVRLADGLKTFTDATKTVGSLFKPYDMSRLSVPHERIQSSYIETVMDFIEEEVIIRDAPKWVMAQASKKGVRKIKISTWRQERYENSSYEIVEESSKDIVLAANTRDFRVGVFLSPAFFKHSRKIDITTLQTEESLEVRYWFKGRFQSRYLSVDPSVTYHVSKHGPDTLVSDHAEGSARPGSFQHTITDFFFFSDDEPRIKHLQYFQKWEKKGIMTSAVSRKSSVWNTYKEIAEKGEYLITDLPLPDEVDFVDGKIFWGEILIPFGKQFVYRIHRVEEKQASSKQVVRGGARAGGRFSAGKGGSLKQGACRSSSLEKISEHPKKQKFKLTLIDCVPQPLESSGRFDDFKEDLDPWESIGEYDVSVKEDKIPAWMDDF